MNDRLARFVGELDLTRHGFGHQKVEYRALSDRNDGGARPSFFAGRP
jgi:hypothetical protein